ncbi:hypothetical protein PTSG_02518 [Salpingoeca rosetta]|uniref:MYND-type domain-containing protein n=1 Tax=Salpingoeca rosetta (strain ATCC 50818 / BSB-021) TaxID=946362 RepID=F2U2F4_SALR5|nr:uncharacterized protein PTSG_02518 [Salpingoeca rosetta]EGD81806.1 hypothetical protein PTSG_02518 [Salpingoeca rosetta]|eukprot:XP_004997010.1 hypothetical protein PTSG_02518 [Salpingoeca rosetta]
MTMMTSSNSRRGDGVREERPPTPTLDELMGGMVVETQGEVRQQPQPQQQRQRGVGHQGEEDEGLGGVVMGMPEPLVPATHQDQQQQQRQQHQQRDPPGPASGRSTPELDELVRQDMARVRVDSNGNPIPLPPLPSDETPILHERVPAVRQGASSQHPALTPYVSLEHAVSNLYGTMLASAQEADAFSDKQDPNVLLSHMSDGVTFPYELPARDSTPATDLCRLVLLPSDFESLEAEPMVFFLGYRDWQQPDQHVDIHLPFCGLVTQVRCTFKDLLQAETSPQWLTAEWAVFEDRRGAQQYYKRAWRTLSNNPPVDPDDDTPGSANAYNHFTFPPADPFVAGEQCRVFQCSSPVSLRSLGRVVFNAVIIVNVQVENVVLKLYCADITASCDELRTHVEPIVQTAAQRMRIWARDTSIARSLKAVPPYIQLHRQQLFAAWQELVEKWNSTTFRSKFPIASARDAHVCAHCKRTLSRPLVCSGCREVAYCSGGCQRRHWAVHKQSCTRCFDVWKKGAELYCKARVQPKSLPSFR